jgi:hypothetical protein
MKKLYYLDESEKERILNMHKVATKNNYLIKKNDDENLIIERPVKKLRNFLFGKGPTEKYGGVNKKFGKKDLGVDTYSTELKVKLKEMVNAFNNNEPIILVKRITSAEHPQLIKLRREKETIKGEDEELKTLLSIENGKSGKSRDEKKITSLVDQINQKRKLINDYDDKIFELSGKPYSSFEFVSKDINLSELYDIIEKNIKHQKLTPGDEEILKQLFNPNLEILKTPAYDYDIRGNIIHHKSIDKEIETIKTTNDELNKILNRNSPLYDVRTPGIINRALPRWVKRDPIRALIWTGALGFLLPATAWSIATLVRWLGNAYYKEYTGYKNANSSYSKDIQLEAMCSQLQGDFINKSGNKGKLTFLPNSNSDTTVDNLRNKKSFNNILSNELNTITKICNCQASFMEHLPQYDNENEAIKLHRTVERNFTKENYRALLTQITSLFNSSNAINKLNDTWKKIDKESYDFKNENFYGPKVKQGNLTGEALKRYARVDNADQNCKLNFINSLNETYEKNLFVGMFNMDGSVKINVASKLDAFYVYYVNDKPHIGCKEIAGDIIPLIIEAKKLANQVMYASVADKVQQDFIAKCDEIKTKLKLS